MISLRRFACRLWCLGRSLLAQPATESPELWCRGATVLALRDPRRAGAAVAGWR
jgi:hypothetical protein